jgi:hypothetical protein
MGRSENIGQRFAALFTFGLLLFNYPMLAIFNAPAMLLGVPVLYAYIFIAWMAMIVLMAIMAESTR